MIDWKSYLIWAALTTPTVVVIIFGGSVLAGDILSTKGEAYIVGVLVGVYILVPLLQWINRKVEQWG